MRRRYEAKRRERIEEAKHLLESSDQAVDEICFAIGYEDPSFFRRLFKRRTGGTRTVPSCVPADSQKEPGRNSSATRILIERRHMRRCLELAEIASLAATPRTRSSVQAIFGARRCRRRAGGAAMQVLPPRAVRRQIGGRAENHSAHRMALR